MALPARQSAPVPTAQEASIMAQPSTPTAPAPAATPTATPAPAATATKSEPKFTVAGFADSFVKAVTPATPPAGSVDSLSLAFIGLGGQRKAGIGEALQSLFTADQAVRDRASAMLATLNERLAAASGSKRTAPAVSPAQRFAASVMALDSAITAVPVPDGLGLDEADAIRAAVRAGKDLPSTVGTVDSAKVETAAKRAVAAVSRGGSINRGETKARKSGTGTMKDHVAEAVKSVKVGETVGIADIVKFESKVYGADGARPSVGHVRDTLAKKDGSLRSGDTWTAVADSDGKVTGAKRTK